MMISQQAVDTSFCPPPVYYCNKNHKLIWKSSDGNTCGECKKKNCRSRYWCTQCAEAYCHKCMPPPLFGIICGAGHAMKMCHVPHHICDNCSDNITSDASRCQICDFDVCLSCLLEKED